MTEKRFIPTHLFSANAITKPYAPVMTLKKFNDTNVYEVMIKNGKVRFFSYNKLIDEFGYTKETIADLMEELKQ